VGGARCRRHRDGYGRQDPHANLRAVSSPPSRTDAERRLASRRFMASFDRAKGIFMSSRPRARARGLKFIFQRRSLSRFRLQSCEQVGRCRSPAKLQRCSSPMTSPPCVRRSWSFCAALVTKYWRRSPRMKLWKWLGSIPELRRRVAQLPPNCTFLQKPFRFATLLEQLKLMQQKR
jgi:hypothetical protein